MKDTFLTVENETEGLYKEKGSKFLSFVYPVKNEEEVKAILDGLRKKYYDARHHCYAYMLGREMENFRANDDGEPNHSAGDPILGQIRSNGITDVLIVVIRYFGGIKLGVGGLIHAYKTAAAEAISANRIVEKTVKKHITIQFDYPHTNIVMRWINEYEMEIIKQEFQISCRMTLAVPASKMRALNHQILETSDIRIIH